MGSIVAACLMLLLAAVSRPPARRIFLIWCVINLGIALVFYFALGRLW